jgi:hypothetical protein
VGGMSLLDLPQYLDVAVVSADHWHGELRPYSQTRQSQFKASATATHHLLRRELDELDATDRTLYVQVAAEQFRRDGRPRLNATVLGPGVVLTFVSDGRTYEYVGDSFSSQQENLRAIALTLENLRAVARYGCTGERQQYAGFLALESSAIATEAFSSTAAAIEFLTGVTGGDGKGGTNARLVRLAKFRTHPDTSAGDRDPGDYNRVLAAESYLTKNGAI